MGNITISKPSKTSFPVHGVERSVYHEHFDNPSDFLDTVLSRKCKEYGHDLHEDTKLDRSWVGVGSVFEGLELFRLGKDPKGDYGKLRAEFDNTFKNLASKRTKMVYSPAGGRPVVPRVLAELPDYRVMAVKKKVPKTAVSLAIDISCSAYVGAETMSAVGLEIVRVLAELKAKHINCEISVVSGQYVDDNDTIITMAMPVKKLNQPLDIAKLGYCLTNPSFYRVMVFGWIASHQHYRAYNGLGRPVKHMFNPEQYAEFYKTTHGLEHVVSMQRLADSRESDRRQIIMDCLGL